MQKRRLCPDVQAAERKYGREYGRAYYPANRDERLAYAAEYVTRPGVREQRAVNMLAWQRANPEKCARNNANRRARELGAVGVWTLEEWADILEQHGHQCAHCGAGDVPLEKDHITPLTLGGSNWPENLQPLCRTCNARKGNRWVG
jgi:5-methylcytosine-specific restriction endonuclease McrA